MKIQQINRFKYNSNRKEARTDSDSGSSAPEEWSGGCYWCIPLPGALEGSVAVLSTSHPEPGAAGERAARAATVLYCKSSLHVLY